MKTKPLTRIELATLAASLPTGTASERVKLAFGIWDAADPVKVELAFLNDRISAAEAYLPKPVLIFPLSLALETILPDERAAFRLRKWEDFRAWQHANGIEAPSFDDEKRNGVMFSISIYDEIKAWQAAVKKATAKEKASNAANVLWDKKRAGTSSERKARGKTQQVKKKAKS